MKGNCDFQSKFAKLLLLKLLMEEYLFAYRKFILYEFNIENVPLVKAKIMMKVKEVSITDLDKLAEMRTTHRAAGESLLRKDMYLMKLMERIQANHRCFVGIKNNEILSYAWLAFREIYSNGIKRKILLRNKEALLYDIYADPSYRKRGVISEIISQAFIQLRENGYQRVFSLVRSYNEPSKRTMKKLNGKIKGEILFLKILTFCRCVQPEQEILCVA